MTQTVTKPTTKAGIGALAVSPEDIDFWERAALAALSGVSSEVRLTAAQAVEKSVNCADKMFEARAKKLDDFLPIAVTLSPTSDTVAATAETSSFQVNATGTGTWTAVADAAATWLTVVAPTTDQTVSGAVTYAVAANAGALRTANITVNDQTFTVTQSAGV